MRLKIEKLVEGGQGFVRDEDKTFFVWNALPDEELEVEILNKRRGIFEARAITILKTSPHRIEPNEDHYLSCSPWQIMDINYENQQKVMIALEDYRRIGKLDRQEIKIFSNNNEFNYRNKMEFSFVEKDGQISLAFFNRGQKKKVAIEDCKLATSVINKVAKKILDWINENKLTERNLKSLIIRSNLAGETIAGLFIKDKLEFKNFPELDENFLGFDLYYSTHKSPASVITNVLYQEGQNFLVEEVLDKKFKYGLNSFFQINIPVFEMALKDIINETKKNNKDVVDFYSGVGSIGISVGAKTLVESNAEAVGFTKENLKLNKVSGDTILAPTEKTLEYITADSTIIFDPPRAGLHPKIIDRILEVKPQKIIYLSCNIATHARDIGLLKDTYNIKSLKLYNFFPRTPHVEGLAILELK